MMEREKKWYIIHTYSGYERKVAESLMNRIEAYDLGDCIGQILIPTVSCAAMTDHDRVRQAPEKRDLRLRRFRRFDFAYRRSLQFGVW